MRQIVAQQQRQASNEAAKETGSDSKAERATKAEAAAWLCQPDVLEEKKNEKTQRAEGRQGLVGGKYLKAAWHACTAAAR
jgi:hypothetical protein